MDKPDNADEKIICDASQLAGLAPVSIMCFNCQGKITFVNDWHLHHFARDRRVRDDYLGKDIFDLPGIMSAGLADNIEDVFSGTAFQAENVYTSEFSGGQSGYQTVRALPVNKDGRLIGGIVIREDVTRYVLSEKKVVDSERKIKALLNATPDSAILVDARGTFLALNSEAARRRNTSVPELIGKSLYDHLPEGCARLRRCMIAQALQEKRAIAYQEQLDSRVYAVSVYPVINDAGEVDALASFSQDITLQLRHEKELIKAKEMAESASVVKSQFLANISHELRTPLNGIMGMAQVGLTGQISPDQKECLEIIRDSSIRLTNVINNLLDLADIESGALEPIIKEFDLHDLLRSIANNFLVQAKLKGLGLDLRLAAGVPERLCGDEFRLRQSLVCLMSNALKCTNAGRIEIGVDFGPSAGSAAGTAPGENAVDLVFHVEDTGIGIEAEKMGTIFDSFTLAEDVLTKRHSGVGIGLCIARNLVSLLGGEIGATSELGRGSRFYFHLRLALPRIPAGEEALLLPTEPAPQATGQRILLVEDEVINRVMTTTLLRRMGYTVFEAENGVEALRSLSSQPIDVILMDIQMPMMDGIEATGHIRNGEVPGLDRTIPIVALTAYAREKDRKRFLELGMDDFVPKPFVAEDLARVITGCLARRCTSCPG